MAEDSDHDEESFRERCDQVACDETTELLIRKDLQSLQERVRKLEKRRESRCSNGSVRFQDVNTNATPGENVITLVFFNVLIITLES